MAQNPQTVVTDKEIPRETYTRPLLGDEIVISGMSGLFPKSNTTAELMENLYNKVDMVEEISYSNMNHPNLPKHQGKVKELHKFDSQFFRVTHWQAASLEPTSRKVMESAFSAIYDSGTNPLSLAGTKLGVFIGTSFADTVTINMYDCFKRNAFIISGCSKTMVANRVSYWIDGRGPSFGLDQACASSMACLEHAYNSIKRGDCDSAIVGGCSSCVHPILCLNLRIAGHLCMDGKTKCFDKKGDGYVRSEAVSLLFLQKAKDAKRIYTEIYHVKGKYFMSPDANFLPIRNSEDLEKFLQEFYSEVKISPSEVEYIEAFGSGIAEADGNELNAIGNFFAKSRSIKVGSVKSNMGHTEAANGACALTKMCLAYQRGELPGNLNYDEPQEHISAVRDGRIQVVTENTPFNRSYTAVNSYSYTGANFHVLLKGHYKHKDKNRYQSNIPHLVLLSGREDTGMNQVLDILAKQPIDAEQIALLHNIHNQNFSGHTGRSYIILDTNENNETVSLARNFEFYSGTKHPICFLYSGMGSQWCGMGTELMRIPIFAAAIEKCRKVLEPLGVNIVKILTDPDKSSFDCILHSMVGISAVQIGLTDVLKAMGIVPDIIIGHSIGELGCAYGDECFTTEEMILSSYSRGLVSINTPFIKGSMAAIGLGYREVLPLLPPEIEVACHNSAVSATISGPADIMNQFVADLTSRGIFAREVACSNIAYHSKHIAQAGPELLSHMQGLVKDKKLRSKKWISTSVPQENWDQDSAKYASAEYFTNNLLSPVYFEENASLIPRDAVLIEIAPHGLLQAIVKTSHSTCVNIPLTRRACSDPVTFFLEAIGKMYLNGLNPHVDALYPKVEFPVSTETPLMAHLVKWEHSVDWPQTVHNRKEVKGTSGRNVLVSIQDEEFKFIEGHVRNGIIEFPESVLLVLVWETLGMYKGKNYKEMSVIFSEVTFHRQLKLGTEDVLRLRLLIQTGSNRFELSISNAPVVTGFITEELDVVEEKEVNKNEVETENKTIEDDIYLSGEDVYALLCMRGYSYKGDFQSIHSLCGNNAAFIKWNGDWVPFLDSVLQFNALSRDHDGVSIPKNIQQLVINVDKQKIIISTLLDYVPCYKTEIIHQKNAMRCGGVELEGITFEDKPKLKQPPDVLLSQEFIPHLFRELVDFEIAVSVNLQLVADNVRKDKIKVLELVTSSSASKSDDIRGISEKIPSCNFDISAVEVDPHNIHTLDISKTNMLVVHNLLQNQKTVKLLKSILKEDTFVLTLEENVTNNQRRSCFDMKIITMMQVNCGVLVLLKKCNEFVKENVLYIPLDYDTTFSWLPRVLSELEKTRRVVLISERQPNCGLLGFVKYLNKAKGSKIGLVILNDYHTSSFTPDNDNYKDQLENNLTFNVLNKGQWGSYYYIPNSKSFKIPRVNLTSSSFGDLESFIWNELPPTPEENFVQICYAGLSSRDCRKALGNIKEKSASFGIDFSGTDSKGQRVMGMVANGALGSTIEADLSLMWPVPRYWSLEEAATIPLPYIHAYYCLAIKSNIERNQTVFVTGGAGALGQAIISICLSLDCIVLTSVSNERKKCLLLKLFPKLKEQNIILSCHDFFYMTIINLTKNRKCNIVVNCNSGLPRQAAMKCVGFMGKFLDVSEIDITDNKNFGMYYLTECKSYISVNLSSLLKPGNYNQRKVLQTMVAEGIANGTVRPLSRVVYSPKEVSRAFKLVSSGRHRGRALIRMDFTESINVVPGINYSNGVHVVVCDRTNVGVELIDHLVRNGVRTLLVHLKPDYHTNYLYTKASSWAKFNIKIDFNFENLQTKEGCEMLLKAGQKLGSVTSIFIVQDYKEEIINDNIERSDFKLVFDEAVLVTDNLDTISRNMCDGLRYFVKISAATQNIASEYATSACAKICEARKEVGLPALIVRCEVPNEVYRKNYNILSKLELPTISALFHAMDIGLKYNQNNVFSLNILTKSSPNYIQALEGILDVQSIDDLDENATLTEIGINYHRVEEIKSGLSPITDSVENLGEIPFGSLKKLCKNYKRRNKNFNVGLGAFYNIVEKDEYNAMDAVIPLNSYWPCHEADGYMERCDTYLIMIPGFEGHSRIFDFMAERIKIRAATFQLGPDLICQSITDMAKILADRMKSNFEMYSKFYILGYSFGVNVALEVANILEAEGRAGVVYCLDSSPDALRIHLNAYASNLSRSNLENSILAHMCRLISSKEDIELKQVLEKLGSWSEKLETCIKRLRNTIRFTNDHIRSILQSAYDRIMLAKEYEPDFKLNSELVLIRGIPHPRAENLSDDYNLSKYTKQPVKVFDIDSDHVAAPYDCRVSNIVNKILDPKILEEFKTRNLCDIYYRRSKVEM